MGRGRHSKSSRRRASAPPGHRPDSNPAGGRKAGQALLVLAAVGVAIFALAIVIGLAVVGRKGGGSIQGWDNTVGSWYLHHRSPLVGTSKVVASLGDAPILGVISVGLSLLLLVTIRSVRALVPVLAYLGGEFVVYATRLVIHRPRPVTAVYPASGAIRGIHETSYSFPSGHSVAVTAVLVGIFGAFALSRRTWWPWLLAAFASLFVIDTRLVLGVHWFSDVVFGFGFGTLWGVTAALVLRTVEWGDIRALLGSRTKEETALPDERFGIDERSGIDDGTTSPGVRVLPIDATVPPG